MRLSSVLFCCTVVLGGCQSAPTRAQVDPYDTGGPLMPEQAAYDVTFYDLALQVDPADRSIHGTLTATARIVHPTAWFVLDLDPNLDVEAVADAEGQPLSFERRGGKLWAALPFTRQPGDTATVAVTYGGHPRVAPNPPWNGGFIWSETPSGQPWIATACQSNGADLWWPVKDHVSDEPDSMALHITVPEPLVVASNGRLRGVEAQASGTRTYHWFISTPINTYNVALNIAPYEIIDGVFESVAGTSFPVVFYVLPEDVERGRQFFPEILDQLRFYEETLGPYPFRADKYGVAQTPHLGMEHQTIIAYGAGFDNGAMTGGTDWGFDALHQHELSHEWWGNLVTNADWSDMWLHEGFGTYMQPLYKEHLDGAEGYRVYMASMRGFITNQEPVAPRGTRSGGQIYGGDIYYKGAWVLHTLRFLLGDDVFHTALRRMAYPDTSLAQEAAGCPACRFATTDDFVHLVELLSGQEMDWFFEVYLRQPDLPRLVTSREGDLLHLAWEAPGETPFPLPVEIQLGDEVRRVALPEGRATISVPEGVEPVIDPHRWLLKAE